MITIMGIDPGSRITGYGIIASNGYQHRYITSGHICAQGETLPERLQSIHQSIVELVQSHTPEQFAIEDIFMRNNARSALKLGQARGAAIVACSHNVAEYSPRQIKQAVVGHGGADKTQIQHMITRLLKLEQTLQADEADGLAVAICHAHMASTLRKLGIGKNIKRGRIK